MNAVIRYVSSISQNKRKQCMQFHELQFPCFSSGSALSQFAVQVAGTPHKER